MVRPLHRAAVGALAGVSATLFMTEAMNRMYRRLPTQERYPLPPRELVERCWPIRWRRDEAAFRTGSLVAHFGYGALCGAILGLCARRPGLAVGSAFGVLVWGASYMGWAPLTGRLRPATSHPGRRNALMVAAHLIWGAGTALGYRALMAARGEMLAGGRLADAPRRLP